jgi:O-acetyl-ADP-ribose deacetylase (regulator of RNase III)
MLLELPKSVIELECGDITAIKADVVVNAANGHLARGGGVCGAIFSKAGTRLDDHCMRIYANHGAIKTGDAVITPAYNLETAKYIVHAVGPIYEQHDPADARLLLMGSYSRSLLLADLMFAEDIAFPAISTGIYKYPLSEAADAALDAVMAYMSYRPTKIKKVSFVLFDETTKEAFFKAAERMKE